jgi:hypothetical protein
MLFLGLSSVARASPAGIGHPFPAHEEQPVNSPRLFAGPLFSTKTTANANLSGTGPPPRFPKLQLYDSNPGFLQLYDFRHGGRAPNFTISPTLRFSIVSKY